MTEPLSQEELARFRAVVHTKTEELLLATLDNRNAEIAALRERLEAAEAVCEATNRVRVAHTRGWNKGVELIALFLAHDSWRSLAPQERRSEGEK